MTTARTLITDTLLELGIIAEDESPTAAQAQSSLRWLNRMLGQWNIQGLIPWALVRTLFSLTAGQGTYTLGTGGEWDMHRPNEIESAFFRETATGLEIPARLLTDEEYQAITLKDTEGSWPRWVYNNRAVPRSTVTVYPVPSIPNEIVLYTWVRLRSFPDLDTEIDLPEGYEEAMLYNLAPRLAPSFSREPSVITLAMARETLANIKSKNTDVPLLGLDAALVEGDDWDYRTDTWGGRS